MVDAFDRPYSEEGEAFCVSASNRIRKPHHHQHQQTQHESGSAPRSLPILAYQHPLLTNHPQVIGLDAFGLEIVEQIPLVKHD